MRTIGVVTSARADYSVYLPVLRRIQADPDLKLYLMVTGMHLVPEFGMTANLIEADGFEIGQCIETLLASDSPSGIAKSMGMGILSFAQAFAQFKPDILVVLGDRFEMAAAPLAALPFKIPVAHLHGGELTFGAIDDALRHAITKLSHLHFVSTEAYAKRVIQLGEEPWRVILSGAPSLDNLKNIVLLDRVALEQQFAIKTDPPPLLVTFHPVTLEHEDTDWQTDELLAALDSAKLPLVFTLPNADTNGSIIIRKIRAFVEMHSQAYLVENFGTQGYFSIMSCAAAMVGNSSSGILEAASFKLPVVNIGTRQLGRVRAKNVIDVGYPRGEVLAGIRQALDPAFRESLKDLQNPYGDGNAAERIVTALKTIPLDERLLRKQFFDLNQGE